MAKQEAQRSSKTIEWVGGIASLSTTVDIAGVSIQPDILLWMDDRGAAVGYTLGGPGTMLDTAARSLREAIAHRPRKGEPPQRLRVSSPELAEVLLSELRPKIEIVCAPTPELEAMIGILEKQLREDPPEPSPKQSAAPVGLETKAALLQAVAKLTKLKPWTVVSSFRNGIAVTAEACGVRGGMLSLSRDEDGSLEAALLASRDDFNAMVAYKEEAEREDRELQAMEGKDIDEEAWFNKPRLKMPPFIRLTFNPGTKPARSSPILAARKGGWEPVASDSSIWFIVKEGDKPPRHPVLKEAILMEAVLSALPDLLKEKEQLQAAWQNGAPLVRTISAMTHVGAIAVEFGAP